MDHAGKASRSEEAHPFSKAMRVGVVPSAGWMDDVDNSCLDREITYTYKALSLFSVLPTA